MQKNFAQTDYAATARQAAAEGAVLLRYHRHALPLEKGCCVAVFGRNQLHYYRCGIGSGGMVNSAKIICDDPEDDSLLFRFNLYGDKILREKEAENESENG